MISIPFTTDRLPIGLADSINFFGQSFNEFVRTRIREDGFVRHIMPPLQISNDELDRLVDTDRPVRVIDATDDDPFAAYSEPNAALV